MSKGIYQDRYGFRAVVNTAVGRKEKRFPPNAEPDEIKRWREETKGRFAALARRRPKHDATARGTLAADARRYVKGLTIQSAKSRTSDLKAWTTEHGDLPRDRLTLEHVRRLVKQWQDDGVKAWTIIHRVNALRQLYRTLDGADAPTPVDGLELPRPKMGAPVFVAAAHIARVAHNLKALGEHRTLGRHLVLATHGVRPAELMRALPADVDLSRGIWPVRTAKGGVDRVLRLNTADMKRAWRIFIAANAWGPYDTSRHAKLLRRAGWPKDVRPSKLRGTWGMELSRQGTDTRDVQELMGHADIETTMTYYVPPDTSRLARATKGTARRFAGHRLPTLTANKA